VILQVAKESCGKTRVTVVRPGKGTRHRSHGVGVVTGGDGGEEGLLEILRAGQEAPEGAWERAQDVRPVVPDGEGCLACGEKPWELGSDPAVERWCPRASVQRGARPLQPIQKENQVRAESKPVCQGSERARRTGFGRSRRPLGVIGRNVAHIHYGAPLKMRADGTAAGAW